MAEYVRAVLGFILIILISFLIGFLANNAFYYKDNFDENIYKIERINEAYWKFYDKEGIVIGIGELGGKDYIDEELNHLVENLNEYYKKEKENE